MALLKTAGGAANAAKSTVDPPARDERDLTIERLERALADERQNATALREASDALRFKVEILEKSYAKQLADARHRATAAEYALAEQRANSNEFGSDRDETIRLLKEARAELAQVKLDRDQLRQQLAARGRPLDRTPFASHEATGDGGGTINQLIANADWSKDKDALAQAGSHLEARVALEQEAPHTDMLAPELVFTKGKDDEN